MTEIIALDLGDRFVGVARASLIAKIPEPLEEIDLNVADLKPALDMLKSRLQFKTVVIGRPLNQSGQETDQTRKIHQVVERLKAAFLDLNFVWQDESLTSVRADELKKQKRYETISQHSLSACIILEDFLSSEV